MPSTNPYNVLILGYGYSAKIFHIPFISRTSGLTLHSILQRPNSDPTSTRTDAATDFPNVKVFKGWEEVEEYQRHQEEADGRIDVLVVTVGNALHAEYVRRGLELGMHVVVEKPMCITSVEADELIQLAKEKGKILTVYHNRRLDSDYLTLLRLLPTLSRITHIRSSYNRYISNSIPSKAWKRTSTLGNGILYDLGSHLIDQALNLVNHHLIQNIPTKFIFPSRVMALLHDERGTYYPQSVTEREGWGKTWIDDGFDVWLYFDLPSSPNFPTPINHTLTIHLTSSSLSPRKPPERFLIRTSTGQEWVKHGKDPQEDQLRHNLSSIDDPEFGVEKEEEGGGGLLFEATVGGTTIKKEKKIRGEYMRFYGNLAEVLMRWDDGGEGKGKGMEGLLVKPEEGRAVVRVIEAVERSWKEGRVIEWEEVEGWEKQDCSSRG